MAYLRKKTRSDHVTRKALPRGIMRPVHKATVQSFAIIKNTGHGNFVIGCFQTRPLLRFFLREGGGCIEAQSETDNPYFNCPSKLMDKVRQIVHSRLKPFHFQIKTYYPSNR